MQGADDCPYTILESGSEWSLLLDLRLSINWDPDSLGDANGSGCIRDEATIRNIGVALLPLCRENDWLERQSREKEQRASCHLTSVAA